MRCNLEWLPVGRSWGRRKELAVPLAPSTSLDSDFSPMELGRVSHWKHACLLGICFYLLILPLIVKC